NTEEDRGGQKRTEEDRRRSARMVATANSPPCPASRPPLFFPLRPLSSSVFLCVQQTPKKKARRRGLRALGVTGGSVGQDFSAPVPTGCSALSPVAWPEKKRFSAPSLWLTVMTALPFSSPASSISESGSSMYCPM